jgi:hypothetical protein
MAEASSFGWEYGLSGQIRPVSEPVFRKYTDSHVELEIARLLQTLPHPHIVEIYAVGDDHYDMEILRVPVWAEDAREMTAADAQIWRKSMGAAKEWLQGLGIAYIDWHTGNIGWSADGCLKLFDFDSSALEGWPVPECKLFREAVAAGCSAPREIDDWAFVRASCELQLPQAPCDPAVPATPASEH